MTPRGLRYKKYETLCFEGLKEGDPDYMSAHFLRLSYKLWRKTQTIACGMKAAFLGKTIFLLLDISIKQIYNLNIMKIDITSLS